MSNPNLLTLFFTLGETKSDDIIFLYSKSGNTKELLETAPYFQKKKCFVIGVFCNAEAKLNQYCKKCIVLPCGKELDNGFDLYIKGDLENFTESFVYSGEGAVNSTFILKHIQFQNKISSLKKDIEVNNLSLDYDRILCVIYWHAKHSS